MKRCRRCDASIDEMAAFCPECGAPQTDDAETRFESLVEDELGSKALPAGGAGGDLIGRLTGDTDRLWDRVSYVVAFVTVVLALSLVTEPVGWVLMLAGLVALPPTRWLLGRPFGRPFIREFMVALYVVFAAIAAALFLVL